MSKSQTATRNVPDRTASAFERMFVINLAVCAGMFLLGLANFVMHTRYPAWIVWLPAGLAFGMMLVKGPSVLPGIVLGAAASNFSMYGDYVAAVIFGLASGASSMLAFTLLAPWRPKDGHWLKVRTVGRILLVGVGSYMLAGVLLGPYAISELVKHPEAAPAITNPAKAAPGTHAARDHSTNAQKSHSESHTGANHHVDLIERLLMESVGALLITPMVLHWGTRYRGLARVLRVDRARALAACTVLIAVAIAIYSGFIEENFGIVHTTLLVLPPAIWLALEHETNYTLITNLAVSAITWTGTSLGNGPFKDHSSGLPILTMVFVVTALLVAASRAERKAAERTIHRLATVDALTGIPNRATFTAQLREVLDNARRYPRTVAVMFIDLDNFKQVNDTLGHQTGDLLLTEVARRMKGCLQENSLLARFGGDEFVLMIDHVREHKVLSRIAQRIASQTCRPIDIDGVTSNVSCSIGISLFPDDTLDAHELLMKADIAMYGVKAQGRNGHAFFATGMLQSDGEGVSEFEMPLDVPASVQQEAARRTDTWPMHRYAMQVPIKVQPTQEGM